MEDWNIISAKQPDLASMDYYRLREIGIDYLQELSGKIWTDFNIHDPGVTILEVLCYAITDLGYRTSQSMKDILDFDPKKNEDPHQKSFYTAPEILHNYPLTVKDYRKLLIDDLAIKNAWLEAYKGGERGLYKVLLELEEHPSWGDVHSKILGAKLPYEKYFFDIEATIIAELDWKKVEAIQRMEIKSAASDFTQYDEFSYYQAILTSQLLMKGSTKPITETIKVRIDLIADRRGDLITPDVGIGNMVVSGETAKRKDYERFFEVADENNQLPLEESFKVQVINKKFETALIKYLSDTNGFVYLMNAQFLKRKQYAEEVVERVKDNLHNYRNLCEDFEVCKALDTIEIAIQSEIILDSEAIPEEVLANIYFKISEFFSPTVGIYDIHQMIQKEKSIGEIYEGPQLQNGFIDDKELEKYEFKGIIYSSNLIQVIMSVEGVKAVRDINLSSYVDGIPMIEFETEDLLIKDEDMPDALPRLSIQKSNFKLFKGEEKEEVEEVNHRITRAIFSNLHAVQVQKNYVKGALTLALPKAEHPIIANYHSIQNDFPSTYGIGEDGVPARALPERRSQAHNLKAYLLFFDQLLANYIEQLSKVKDLFALNGSADDKTYYFQVLKDVPGIRDIIEGHLHEDGTPTKKFQITFENDLNRMKRKNRFLNHLIGRFSENFADYALHIFGLNKEKTLAKQIELKYDFLQTYPLISNNRADAFHYKKQDHCSKNKENIAGLQMRICKLLGIKNWYRKTLAECEEEGFWMVEHILLRLFPDSNTVKKLKAILKIDATEKLAFRMSIVLPDWPGRFSNKRMRNLVERTLFLEAPAHLLLNIQWLNQADMARFEKLYLSFLSELATH